jgi:hypothetical protein
MCLGAGAQSLPVGQAGGAGGLALETGQQRLGGEAPAFVLEGGAVAAGQQKLEVGRQAGPLEGVAAACRIPRELAGESIALPGGRPRFLTPACVNDQKTLSARADRLPR